MKQYDIIRRPESSIRPSAGFPSLRGIFGPSLPSISEPFVTLYSPFRANCPPRHFFPAGVGDCTCQLLEINAADEELDETEVDETEADMGKELRQRAMVVLSDIDWARCARFTVLGAGFIAPSLHTWYGFLARNFSDLSVTTIARRLALDQLVFTPVFLAGFLSMVMLVDGQAAKVCHWV